MLLLLLACGPLVIRPHSFADETGDLALFVPSTPTGPIVALFPADGHPYRALPRALHRTAEEEGWVLVGLRPPGTRCWWSPHKGRRAAFVEDVVAGLLAIPGTRGDQVVLAGWSGGAFFAAGVPFQVAPDFSGAVVGVCGGDRPRVDTEIDWCAIDETQDDPLLPVEPAREAEVARTWTASFTTTRGDEWTPTVDAAADYWRGIGATVREVDAGPGGHCELDVEAALLEGIRAVLRPDPATGSPAPR